MSTVLRIRRFGDPILRAEAKHVSSEEIKSPKLRKLINNIREINKDSQYGVGLAAPQVGVDVALSIIGIRPTPNRPKLEPFEQVIINPAYTGVGEKVDLWEGCMSCGTAEDVLYAQFLDMSQSKPNGLMRMLCVTQRHLVVLWLMFFSMKLIT